MILSIFKCSQLLQMTYTSFLQQIAYRPFNVSVYTTYIFSSLTLCTHKVYSQTSAEVSICNKSNKDAFYWTKNDFTKRTLRRITFNIQLLLTRSSAIAVIADRTVVDNPTVVWRPTLKNPREYQYTPYISSNWIHWPRFLLYGSICIQIFAVAPHDASFLQ